MTVSFYFDIEPQAKQSARFYARGKRVFSYQKGETVRYEETLAWMAQNQLPPEFVMFDSKTPLCVDKLHFVFTPLKTFTKKQNALIDAGCEIYKITKPDLPDNLSKALFDALAGIVYANDAQIASMNDVAKYYGKKRGIYLTITDERII
jgi:Holliday junction resolvase RusA-like endonuclease